MNSSPAAATISLTLRVWRQAGPDQPGGFESHRLEALSTDLSLLEVLDLLNDRLLQAGDRPISFEHDCREGICGSCGFLVNGQAHGPRSATSVCQLYLRQFRDGEELVLEPWRARAFPLLQDLAALPVDDMEVSEAKLEDAVRGFYRGDAA